MKKMLSIMMLILSMSLFSGMASAQEIETSSVIRICYNSDLKVITKKGEQKEKKVKLKDNCFELTEKSLAFTNSRGKVSVFKFTSIEMVINSTGVAYLLGADMNGKTMQVLVHSELKYITTHDPDTGKTHWYFTQL